MLIFFLFPRRMWVVLSACTAAEARCPPHVRSARAQCTCAVHVRSARAQCTCTLFEARAHAGSRTRCSQNPKEKTRKKGVLEEEKD
eukprot:3318474-Rhodomonas_salina.1